MGKNPFAPEKPKKFEYRAPPAPKKVTYVKPKPAPKNSGLKLTYNPRFNIMNLILPVIMGIVGIQVFGSVISALNTSALGEQSEALGGLLDLMPLVMVAMAIIGILGGLSAIVRISE